MSRGLGFLMVLPLVVLGLPIGAPALAGEEKGEGKADGQAEGKAEAKAEKKGRKKDGWKGGKGWQKKKAPTWTLIQIGNELRVVKEDQVEELRKLLAKENEKAAAKAPKDKKPEPRKLAVVMGNFSSQKEAEKYAEKYKEELQAKKRAEKLKKDAKKDAGASKKVPDNEVDL